ncbi:hypothetical protein IC614_08405 [Allosphingosinicella flava]|uniref:N-acetyltransferase domain-containing protein n=1 Tax=Allosphingosinicella flava TaxID=2771430 RepID=A0A7T2GIA3_9SPHN|nr:hypothetical protein [Sphingosinicella flava]QPQ54373.1 hypothetical protein IC614_08405 [Sphingosinicella flava]
MEVVKATSADLDCILGWLEREHQEDGYGFWSNRRLIIQALEYDELTVIREEGDAVAFQVGKHAPDITSIRKDRRGKGHGTALFEAGLRRAIKENVNVLNITCAPATSWTFWRRFGFEALGPVREWGEVKARRVLERRHELPHGTPADVEVAFYPEDALCRDGDAVEPLAAHRPEAVRMEDGTTALDSRVVGLIPENGRDLAVRIIVDGEERCFCKAHYDEAEAAGVIRDWRGGAFYVDRVPPSPNA